MCAFVDVDIWWGTRGLKFEVFATHSLDPFFLHSISYLAVRYCREFPKYLISVSNP